MLDLEFSLTQNSIDMSLMLDGDVYDNFTSNNLRPGFIHGSFNYANCLHDSYHPPAWMIVRNTFPENWDLGAYGNLVEITGSILNYHADPNCTFLTHTTTPGISAEYVCLALMYRLYSEYLLSNGLKLESIHYKANQNAMNMFHNINSKAVKGVINHEDIFDDFKLSYHGFKDFIATLQSKYQPEDYLEFKEYMFEGPYGYFFNISRCNDSQKDAIMYRFLEIGIQPLIDCVITLFVEGQVQFPDI